jgi:hypothetical protein
MIVAVDLDSTLVDFLDILMDVAKEKDIKPFNRPNNWLFDLEYKDGTIVSFVDFTNMIRKAHSPEFLDEREPYPLAAEVLNKVRERGVQVVILSDNHAQSYPSILNWLQKNNFISFNEDDFILTQDKRHWIKTNNPEVVIDDRVRTILFSRYEVGAKVISLEHPYNVNLKNEADGIWILKDWLDIGEVLDTLIDEYKGK